MLKVLIGLGIIFLIGMFFWYNNSGPTADQFNSIKEPRFSIRPSETVLQKKLIGNPNVVGAKAFGEIFSQFYKVNGFTKDSPSPKA